jgi:hypothetical protein
VAVDTNMVERAGTCQLPLIPPGSPIATRPQKLSKKHRLAASHMGRRARTIWNATRAFSWARWDLLLAAGKGPIVRPLTGWPWSMSGVERPGHGARSH